MALTLAACYPEVFAAVGVHSAPPYRSAGHGREALAAMQGRRAVPPPAPSARMAPAVVFQGTSDPVVHRRCGDQVTEQWLEHDRALGVERPERITRSRAAAGRSGDGRGYTVTRWYDARGRKRLEYWRVDGLGHAWSGRPQGRVVLRSARPAGQHHHVAVLPGPPPLSSVVSTDALGHRCGSCSR